MKKIRVEKYFAEQLKQTYIVPVLFLKVFVATLPKAAIEALMVIGLDIKAIIKASRDGERYFASVQVKENGQWVRVDVSLL